MKFCSREIWLQAKRCGKFRRGFVELRILREERSELVVQLSPSWVEFHCATQFADRARQVLLEAQQTPECPMRFAAGRGQLHCGARLVDRSFHSLFSIPVG